MTNKELQEKIARLETELAEVKEMAVAMKKRVDGGGVFKPEDGEKYWYLAGSEKVYSRWWRNNELNQSRYAIGNCFPTEQAAEDAVRVMKLIQKARESQDGFVPDWEDWTQNKYCAYFETGSVCVITHLSRNMAPIFGYWEDESVCEQFALENHDELLWFFTEYRR